MKYEFTKLIDAEKVMALMESFYRITGLPSSITDVEGKLQYVKEGLIMGVGWQRICLEFHRIHPETCKRCIQSDTVLSRKRVSSKRYSQYKCLNGLNEVAVPISIGGEHVVNLFLGQFFYEPPDLTFFRKQAQKYGFDEADYIRALAEVPVIPRIKVEQGTDFLASLAELIVEMGMDHKEILELNEKLERRVQKRTMDLKKAMTEIDTLREILPICAFCKKIRDDEGYWEQVEVYIDKHLKTRMSHSVCPECYKKHYKVWEESRGE